MVGQGPPLTPTAIGNSMGTQFCDPNLCDLTMFSGKNQGKSRSILVPNILLFTFLICTTATLFHAGKSASNLSYSPKYIKMELNIPAHK